MKVRIKDEASAELALRDTADLFFNKMDKMNIDIEVDFHGIRSISRSFAHQYLMRKKQNYRRVTEMNMPENVLKMFNIVDKSRAKSKILDIDSMPVITIQ